MSWQQWQPPTQPALPAMMNPATAGMPMGLQYTAEQWQQMQQQNWQQWAQWQQQYQQWHQQYGAEYQKSLTAMANIGATIGAMAPLMNTTAPPPLPNDAKPPPPPEEPTQRPQPQQIVPANHANQQPTPQRNMNANMQGYSSMPVDNRIVDSNNWKNNPAYSAQSNDSTKPAATLTANNKRLSNMPMEPHTDAKKNKVEEDDMSDPEKKFMKQFAEWEAQFNKWKEQNQDHPDKAQYREYEKKWEAWRNQLLERRELVKKKKLGLLPSNGNGNSNDKNQVNSRPPVPSQPPAVPNINSKEYNSMPRNTKPENPANINPINACELTTIFKNSSNDGIPGLDLVDAPPQPDKDVPQSATTDTASGQINSSDINLEALSKNINNILGDQKLLSMLSLVAQSTSAKTANPVQTTDLNLNNPVIQAPTTTMPQACPQEVGRWMDPPPKDTLRWVEPPSDDSGRWPELGRNWNNTEPVISSTFVQRKTNNPRVYNTGNAERTPAPPTITSYGQSVPPQLQQNYASINCDYGNRDIENKTPYNGTGERSDDRYTADRDFRDCNNYEAFGERSMNSWDSNDHMNVAPAPPTITDFNDILTIDKVVNYEHRSKKQDTVDIKVIPPRLFDYRHKLAARIPLPERPKWLMDTFYNVPEFDPPISSRPPNVQYSRYPPIYSSKPPVYKCYDDYGTYSRRPPNEYSNPDTQLLRDYYPAEERRKYDDFERRPWLREARDYRDKDRWNEYESRRSRDAPSWDHNKAIDTRKLNDMDLDRNVPVSQSHHTQSKTSIDDIIRMPNRLKRPQRIVIILRGPPGSGKTFLAKQIKDRETEDGGSAPRILSLDDYFMVEQEKEVVEDGKSVLVKEMVYEYEECMESAYRQMLLKAFKKTITDGYFSFIIVDNVNDKVKNFEEMWSFAKQNGFEVYVCQLELDVQVCTKRNIHGRSEVEIQHIVSGWEETPTHYGILDATNLIQAGAIPEVEMEEINSPNDDFGDDDDNEEQACNSSKWDNFECSIDNLAKLDGINKPLRPASTMEDYLQLEDWALNTPTRALKAGEKRVRWADLEERKQQEKMRAIGFVVGQTNWDRMMDPTQGGSALTQTLYIERVGVRKVN